MPEVANCQQDSKFIRRILCATEFDNCGDVFWKSENDVLSLYILCNDLFWWGVADAELVTEENINILEQSYQDSPDNGGILFCCRSRKMRPQKPYYREIDESEHHLYNECGPAR